MGPSKASDLIPAKGRVVIAFSGGPDSVCLAHLLATELGRARLVCLHIDHGLDPGSSARAQRAGRIAKQLGIACEIESLALDATSNIEATARAARYQALKQHMAPGDTLVTAHHANDVAETLLLRLLRRASTVGLGGIRAERAFGPGRLIRPLLSWSKHDICAHLDAHGLPSIEDPTNDAVSLDRNYIRSSIMPLLEERFPSAVAALNQSAALNQQVAATLARYLSHDVQSQLQAPHQLSTETWPELSAFHRAELIRQWCVDNDLPTPPGKRLASFVEQVATAQGDRLPALHWPQASIYHYQGCLWLEPSPPDKREALDSYELSWSGQAPLDLPGPLGQLELTPETLERLAAASERPINFSVRSGQPGETMALGDPPVTRRVRSLMSNAHVPPWRRDWWPRLWLDGRLIACGQRWQSACLQGELSWRRAPPSET